MTFTEQENKETITILRADLIRLIKFIEESNSLFHQPMWYKDTSIVEKFAHSQYPEIRHLLYKVLTNVVPDDIKKELWDI